MVAIVGNYSRSIWILYSIVPYIPEVALRSIICLCAMILLSCQYMKVSHDIMLLENLFVHPNNMITIIDHTLPNALENYLVLFSMGHFL